MSWWIYLLDEQGQTCELSMSHTEGGTYVLGGTSSADLNVTYNYGGKFDFKSLAGRVARDTIPELKTAVDKLAKGPDNSNDYWEPTDGNVMRACGCLLSFAEQHPEGIWKVS
jgi:hypothetical protein